MKFDDVLMVERFIKFNLILYKIDDFLGILNKFESKVFYIIGLD